MIPGFLQNIPEAVEFLLLLSQHLFEPLLLQVKQPLLLRFEPLQISPGIAGGIQGERRGDSHNVPHLEQD